MDIWVISIFWPVVSNAIVNIGICVSESLLSVLLYIYLEVEFLDQLSVQFSCWVVSDSLWPHGPQHARPPCPSPTPSSPKPMSIESVMPSNHLILCRPLLLPPSVFSSIRVFSNESALRIRWPKYWSFNFSISPSNEYSGLISLRIDWFDLLGVQGTLKSLLQQHSSKATILQHSAFFMLQLSHPYMTTGKTIVFNRQLCWQSNVSAF